MNPAINVGVFLPLLVIMLEQEQANAQMRTIQLIKRRARKEEPYMNESVKQFIGKNCLIYTYNNQLTGMVVSVEDNWMTLQTKTGSELVNLDYISRIREYPVKKKG